MCACVNVGTYLVAFPLSDSVGKHGSWEILLKSHLHTLGMPCCFPTPHFASAHHSSLTPPSLGLPPPCLWQVFLLLYGPVATAVIVLSIPFLRPGPILVYAPSAPWTPVPVPHQPQLPPLTVLVLQAFYFPSAFYYQSAPAHLPDPVRPCSLSVASSLFPLAAGEDDYGKALLFSCPDPEQTSLTDVFTRRRSILYLINSSHLRSLVGECFRGTNHVDTCIQHASHAFLNLSSLLFSVARFCLLLLSLFFSISLLYSLLSLTGHPNAIHLPLDTPSSVLECAFLCP
ncbi:hypothetical protein QBC33DRAFT_21415 [Phialemonium atrogriseum]|uniref:Uncharacterized protein n=1 Tax=Phialemonium atrogriseum TaxID=1093897 RepID=A0AAJ0C9G2_9PEZI|nr:uncharacterized protein QBC33DRAFT_21415 [Phialemonium atrogriseum]KAK1772628.1 hypothetical protein QBC33DRAFT_21415 [Phialemonium atrogriseum]